MHHDPHRTRFHFQPPKNWMNDPNGLIQWKGEYHLFYQHNPDGLAWTNMHWGHAVSRDLYRWEHLPIAVAPSPEGCDALGIFSGCAVDDAGTPTLMYTGVAPEVQCIATGDANMRHFEKFEGNPVIARPPEGLEVTGFRDPCAWREEDGWRCVIGSGIVGEGGTAFLYRSPDLRSWEYLHPFVMSKGVETGTMWECPDFFALGDKHVLLVSALDTVFYFTGTYTQGRLAVEHTGRLDHGPAYYAAQTFEDERGRRIAFAWLRESRSDAAQEAAGWSGVQSAPRVLSLGPGGQVLAEPAPEIEVLRQKGAQWCDILLEPGVDLEMDDVAGRQFELRAKIETAEKGRVGFVVSASPDGAEQTCVYYDSEANALCIDTRGSSLSKEVETGLYHAPLKTQPRETIELRVLGDGSVVEAFVDNRAWVTARIYPTREDSVRVRAYAQEAEGRFKQIDAWPLALPGA